MKFSDEFIPLPATKLPAELRAAILCNPTAIDEIINTHTSSVFEQDLSNFARHLSSRAKSSLAKLGLRRITASLFVSAATDQYWGFNKDGNLCRMVEDHIADGTIDAFDPNVHADLASAYSYGHMEASLLG